MEGFTPEKLSKSLLKLLGPEGLRPSKDLAAAVAEAAQPPGSSAS